MDYTDLMLKNCGNSTNITECILSETFSQTEMISYLTKGTSPDGSGSNLILFELLID